MLLVMTVLLEISVYMGKKTQANKTTAKKENKTKHQPLQTNNNTPPQKKKKKSPKIKATKNHII